MNVLPLHKRHPEPVDVESIALAKAKVAELERDEAVSKTGLLQENVDNLTAKNKGLEDSLSVERTAKDAANAARDAAMEKTRQIGSQIEIMNGRIAELEKHNNSLQISISRITTEIGKSKPVPVIPDFNFEVTSHDFDGRIKTVKIKPTQR
jgi:prefoldin subunit 5